MGDYVVCTCICVHSATVRSFTQTHLRVTSTEPQPVRPTSHLFSTSARPRKHLVWHIIWTSDVILHCWNIIGVCVYVEWLEKSITRLNFHCWFIYLIIALVLDCGNLFIRLHLHGSTWTILQVCSGSCVRPILSPPHRIAISSLPSWGCAQRWKNGKETEKSMKGSKSKEPVNEQRQGEQATHRRRAEEMQGMSMTELITRSGIHTF